METAPLPGIDPDFEQGYERLRESCGVLTGLDAVAVCLTGDDRKGWLQGQVTNDLRHFGLGGFAQFCLVSVTGQIEADCSAWSLTDRIILTTSSHGLPALLARVERMVILEDVKAEVLPVKLVSVQGPEATRTLGRMLTLPSLDAGMSRLNDEEVLLLRSNRTGLGGWDVLLPESVAALIEQEIPPVAHQAYDVARLEAGVPLMGRDIDAKTMPPELGPAFESRYVSYSKGCYQGQEVLMRLHARGRTQRTWMALIADAPLTVGAQVSHSSRPDAGVVTSVAYSPRYGFIAGAMVRREAAFDGEMVSVDGVSAEVQSMPLLRFE